eukprot:gene12988-15276_t
MLIAFNLFLPFISNSIGAISSLYSTYKAFKGSSYRFFEIMQRVPRIPPDEGGSRERVQGLLVFENVTFGYDDREPVLQDFSITFTPGTITALIGPSGGGKTTTLALIGRLYDVTKGRVTLDGGVVGDWNVHNLHQHVAIVNQEPSLFSGTIADNVAYGRPDASRLDIQEACRLANAHEFVTAMPQGYDTVVGERGMALSGGQKQRIAIARTILRNPTVLLLDEATSELDVESERLVQEAIERLVVGRTVIIVAHRLSTILTADFIGVVADGRVTEYGTPEELVESRGTFYDFVQIQYGKNGGEDITLPPRSRNVDKLRMRGETIKRAVEQDIARGRTPTIGGVHDLLGRGDQTVRLPHRPSSPPLWRKARKHQDSRQSNLLHYNGADPSGASKDILTQHAGGIRADKKPLLNEEIQALITIKDALYADPINIQEVKENIPTLESITDSNVVTRLLQDTHLGVDIKLAFAYSLFESLARDPSFKLSEKIIHIIQTILNLKLNIDESLGVGVVLTEKWDLPNLRSLGIDEINPSVLSMLPATITHLYLGHQFTAEITPGSLPSSVTHLFFGGSYDRPFLANSIPHGVTDIHTGDKFNQSIAPSTLPHTLVNLTFGWAYNTEIVPGALPNSIKRLKFGSSFNQVIKPHMIPESVVTLTFDYSFTRQIQVGALPHSLRDLSLGQSYNNPLQIGTLPPTLKRLNLGSSFTYTIDANVFPSSLTHLIMTGRVSNIPPNTLPSSLTHVHFGLGFEDQHGVYNLPDSITHLSFGTFFKAPLSVLPRKLTHLMFPEVFDHQLTPGCLPVTLEHLVFGRGSNSKSSLDIDSFFDFGQRISCYRIPQIPVGVLPPNLKSLQIGPTCKELTPGCIPPSVSHLSLLDYSYPLKTLPALTHFKLGPSLPGSNNMDEGVELKEYTYECKHPYRIPTLANKILIQSNTNMDHLSWSDVQLDSRVIETITLADGSKIIGQQFLPSY